MQRSNRVMWVLVTVLMGVSATAMQTARGSGVASPIVIDRWELPALGVNGPFEAEALTYLDASRLLVADAYEESIWSIGVRTGNTSPWLESPQFGILPFEIRHEPKADIVFAASLAGLSRRAGALPTQYLVLDRDGSLIGRWRLPDADGAWQARGAGKGFAVSPDGDLVWLAMSPSSDNESQYSAIASASRHGQRRLGARCPELYRSIAVDASARVYLERMLPEAPGQARRYRIDRVSDARCGQPEVFWEYDGSQPFRPWVTMSAWPSPDRILVTDGLLVTAFGATAQRLLSTYVPQNCHDCLVSDVAPRADNHFAVLSGEGSDYGLRNDTEKHKTQVVQYDEFGRARLRTVFRGSDLPVMWNAGRISADKTGRVQVLYPDSDLVATFDASGVLQRTTPVVSWASDLDSGNGLLATKGSSGAIGAVQIRDVEGDIVWNTECGCDESSAVAVADNTVYSGNAAAGRVDGYNARDGVLVDVKRPTGDKLWPLDVASGHDTIYAINASSGHIEAYDMDRTRSEPISIVPTDEDAYRLDALPNGRIAVLTRAGRIHIHTPDGSRTLRFALDSIADDVRAFDVAWSPDGDLLVLDGMTPSVLRIRLPEDAPEASTPTATRRPAEGHGECRVNGTKVAMPDVVMVQETVRVSLTLSIDCPSQPRPPMDAVLVLSGEQMYGGAGTEARDYHSAMLQASERLAGALDLPRDRVAVFQWAHGQHVGLTSDLGEITSAIRKVGPYYGTFRPPDAELWSGLDPALSYLEDNARPGAERLLIQVSSPLLMASYNGVDLAERARQAGVRTLLVYRPWNSGLPDEWSSLLLSMVDSDDDLLSLDDVVAGDALIARLNPYGRWAAVRDIEIRDEVGPDFRLLRDSSAPPGVESPDSLLWRTGAMPGDPYEVSFAIRPTRTGHLPTNVEAVAHYTDPDGVRRRYVFPVPYVNVLAPTPTAIATQTSTVAASPTLTPRHTPVPLYLPIVLDEDCPLEKKRSDVALVLDTSSSMIGQKLADAKGAALLFVSMIDLELGRSQVAVVRYDREAEVVRELTRSRTLTEAAIRSLQVRSGTHIDKGLRTALSELQSDRRARQNTPVMVLLTDGLQTGTPREELRAAAEVRAAGVRLYTIGLGSDVDEEALKTMAGDDSRYYHAPDSADLAKIYSEIAQDLMCPDQELWGRP